MFNKKLEYSILDYAISLNSGYMTLNSGIPKIYCFQGL
jgi:hypothetical protein